MFTTNKVDYNGYFEIYILSLISKESDYFKFMFSELGHTTLRKIRLLYSELMIQKIRIFSFFYFHKLCTTIFKIT